MSTINVPLFLEIREQILAEPERTDMNRWISPQLGVSCGTTCCIAGWACTISAKAQRVTTYEALRTTVSSFFGVDEYLNTPEIAMEILRLQPKEAVGLFHLHIPESSLYPDLGLKFTRLRAGTRKYAETVVEGIDRFLTEKGYDVPRLVAEYHWGGFLDGLGFRRRQKLRAQFA